MTFDPISVRRDFPVLEEQFNGKPLVYLDNAATTQKPNQVIDAISDFYRTSYANVHRSPHSIGMLATEKFEGGRQKVADFINARESAEIVFTRGTSESINIVAGIMDQQLLQPGDVILTTPSEHHSNIVPWQMAARRSGATLEYINLHGEGVFDLDEIVENWNPRTKIFAFQHASNVLGTIHPVEKLCKIASDRECLTLVDGAQSAPHIPLDVQQYGCDFYTISAHKMCGPSGIGGLWAKREHLERFEPIFGGGEMIRKVSLQDAEWNDVPYKFEPGTPNIAGSVGWGAAVDYLTALGKDAVNDYVEELACYAVVQLNKLEGVNTHGPRTARTGAVSFWIDNTHPHDIASILDADGIAVRSGLHCAEPLVNWLGLPATTRASFYIYNTKDEVDLLVQALEQVRMILAVPGQ